MERMGHARKMTWSEKREFYVDELEMRGQGYVEYGINTHAGFCYDAALFNEQGVVGQVLDLERQRLLKMIVSLQVIMVSLSLNGGYDWYGKGRR